MKLFKGKDSLWGKLKQPSVRYSLGVLLLVCALRVQQEGSAA